MILELDDNIIKEAIDLLGVRPGWQKAVDLAEKNCSSPTLIFYHDHPLPSMYAITEIVDSPDGDHGFIMMVVPVDELSHPRAVSAINTYCEAGGFSPDFFWSIAHKHLSK